tara:strand:- start:2244 stop:2654 length:411 start_codon:yes stop_codon:yes gene_type:complete
MTEDTNIPDQELPYQVTNIKYGEKTVTGRVVGRNKTVIPEEEFYQMACLFSTWKDFAEYYDVPAQTLRDNFRDLYIKARQVTKRKLRQKMLETALNGDRVMMIWLSKQWLDMSDAPQSSESDQVLPWLEEPGDFSQ